MLWMNRHVASTCTGPPRNLSRSRLCGAFPNGVKIGHFDPKSAECSRTVTLRNVNVRLHRDRPQQPALDTGRLIGAIGERPAIRREGEPPVKRPMVPLKGIEVEARRVV